MLNVLTSINLDQMYDGTSGREMERRSWPILRSCVTTAFSECPRKVTENVSEIRGRGFIIHCEKWGNTPQPWNTANSHWTLSSGKSSWHPNNLFPPNHFNINIPQISQQNVVTLYEILESKSLCINCSQFHIQATRHCFTNHSNNMRWNLTSRSSG